jgi:hypothetical protein
VKTSASGPVDVSCAGRPTPSGRRAAKRICPVPETAGTSEYPSCEHSGVDPEAQAVTFTL